MVLADGSHSVHWQVAHNDYYFVAVHTIGKEDTIFKANMTFNFTYIDVDDYPWLKDTAQRANGVNQPLSLHRSISSGRINKTLCYLHPLPAGSLDSDSIHISTDYYVGDTLTTLFIASLIAFILLCITCALGTCIICLAKGTSISNRKKGYMLIN